MYYYKSSSGWVSRTGRDLANELRLRVGAASPGDDDIAGQDFYELRETQAAAAYVEAAYHDAASDIGWLVDYDTWAWRIGYAVDMHLGYP